MILSTHRRYIGISYRRISYHNFVPSVIFLKHDITDANTSNTATNSNPLTSLTHLFLIKDSTTRNSGLAFVRLLISRLLGTVQNSS